MSDIRKEIKTVDPNDPRILRAPGAGKREDSVEGGDGEATDTTDITEDLTDTQAIDDEVIDGSHTINLEEVQAEADA